MQFGRNPREQLKRAKATRVALSNLQAERDKWPQENEMRLTLDLMNIDKTLAVADRMVEELEQSLESRE